MTIGDRIKYRREELDISQEELAKKLGYKSRSSINKIELNQRGLTQSKIKTIADALQTTPEYIMGWENPKTEDLSPLAQIQATYGLKTREALELFIQLDSEDQAKILERMQTFLENKEKYSPKEPSRKKAI